MRTFADTLLLLAYQAVAGDYAKGRRHLSGLDV